MWISSRGGGVTRRILGLWEVMVGWVIMLVRFCLNLSRGTCWSLVGRGTLASFAPNRTS